MEQQIKFSTDDIAEAVRTHAKMPKGHVRFIADVGGPVLDIAAVVTQHSVPLTGETKQLVSVTVEPPK